MAYLSVSVYTVSVTFLLLFLSYNLESGVWNTVPINSGLVPRYSHSLAAYQVSTSVPQHNMMQQPWTWFAQALWQVASAHHQEHCRKKTISLQDEIYMFGGKQEGGRGNVTDELWVFNVPSRTWQRRNPVVVQPAQIYAVEGHSAHCIQTEGGDVIMLVIFGYSPIYSYISNVQEYNLSEWHVWVYRHSRHIIILCMLYHFLKESSVIQDSLKTEIFLSWCVHC